MLHCMEKPAPQFIITYDGTEYEVSLGLLLILNVDDRQGSLGLF